MNMNGDLYKLVEGREPSISTTVIEGHVKCISTKG